MKPLKVMCLVGVLIATSLIIIAVYTPIFSLITRTMVSLIAIVIFMGAMIGFEKIRCGSDQGGKK